MKSKVMCPLCGAAMNLHARKFIEDDGRQEDGPSRGARDDAPGQALDIYSCPGCGHITSVERTV